MFEHRDKVWEQEMAGRRSSLRIPRRLGGMHNGKMPRKLNAFHSAPESGAYGSAGCLWPEKGLLGFSMSGYRPTSLP